MEAHHRLRRQIMKYKDTKRESEGHIERERETRLAGETKGTEKKEMTPMTDTT